MAVPTDIEQKIQKAKQLGVPEEVIMQRVQKKYPDYKPVSNVPSTVGMTAGALLGTPLGPVGRSVGASIGAGVGQEVAQAQAGQPGDIGAMAPIFGPLGMIFRTAQTLPADIEAAKQGKRREKTPTEKAMGKGAASQLTGEALSGAALTFINPKNFAGFLDDAVKFITKHTGSKDIIPADVIENKLMKNIADFVSTKGRAEEAQIAGTKTLAAYQLPRDTGIDKEIASLIRKRMGQDISDLPKGMEKQLTEIFYNTLRDVQTELAPAAGPVLSLQRLLTYHAPNIANVLTLGAFNPLKSTLQAGAGAVSKLAGGISRYLVPPFLKTATEQ